jgi:LuxR family maltose regulon positive regulatory protein
MSGALCDSLTGRSDSKQLLRELEKANLFLIPLDSKREWYRYHHLFADSLRAELSKGEEQELQKKAALWFEGTNFKQKR